MSTLSQVVHRASPAAMGGREKSLSGTNTPDADHQEDHVPETPRKCDRQAHQRGSGSQGSTTSMGGVPRAKAPLMRASDRLPCPRLKHLNFGGLEKNWPKLSNDFTIHAHACENKGTLQYVRDIDVHDISHARILEGRDCTSTRYTRSG